MKTISEFMKLEHTHLEEQWEEFSAEKNKKKAERLFRRFEENLLKHIHLEDGALSPTFNRYLGIEKDAGPSVVMSGDHMAIIKLLNKVKGAFDSGDTERLEYAKNHFKRAHLKHHEREEKTHYTFFDKVIAQKEWEDILNGEV